MVCAREGTVKKRMNVERLLRSLWGTFSVVDHLESLGADGLGLIIELGDIRWTLFRNAQNFI